MTAELLLAIATLCQVHPTGDGLSAVSPKEIERHQLACQKYYVACVTSDGSLRSHAWTLGKCIQGRAP